MNSSDLALILRIIAGTSLFTFLSLLLTSCKPNKNLRRSGSVMLAASALRLFFIWTDIPFSIFALMILFALCFFFIYRRDTVYAASSGLLLGIFICAEDLFENAAAASSGYYVTSTMGIGSVAAYLLLFVVILLFTHFDITILPDPEAVIFSDKPLKHAFRKCGCISLFVLLAVFVWIMFLDVNAVYMSAGIFIASMLFTVLMIFLFGVMIHQITYGVLLQIEAELKVRHQTELEDFIHVIRSQRHDFNIHMAAISGLIEHEDYEKAQEYMRSLRKEISAVNSVLPLRDNVVSAMISSLKSRAEADGITVTISIGDDLGDTDLTSYELNILIGNLLKNAIDAVSANNEATARTVELSTARHGGNHIVIISNAFTGDPNALASFFEPGFSTKSGHDGIGLVTVNRILEKHYGSLHPELSGGKLRMIAMFPVILR